MSEKKGCPKGQVKVGKNCHPGIQSKDWTIVLGGSGSSIMIFRGHKIDVGKVADNWRGDLYDTESSWQPPSIQIPRSEMAMMEESNVLIFFDRDDLKKREWENKALGLAK